MAFNDGTRQNFCMLPAKQYSKNNKVVWELPKVGLLARLFLTFKGTVTLTPGTGSITRSERGAFPLIKRIRVIANSGTSIFDVDGWHTHLITCASKNSASSMDSVLDRGTLTENYNHPSTTGTLLFGLEIPISLNPRDPIGLILLQNNATQITVEVEFNQEDGANGISSPYILTGNATSVLSNANCGLAMEYFTVPRNPKDLPPINIIHQWMQQQDTITSTGEYVKSLLRGNTYTKIIHSLTLNGTLNSADLVNLSINYNQSETPYFMDKQTQLLLQRSRYGSDLPRGTFVHDWYYSNGIPALGNSRDFINSAAVTEFQSKINISSGATLGSGNNNLVTLTEQLIQLD